MNSVEENRDMVSYLTSQINMLLAELRCHLSAIAASKTLFSSDYPEDLPGQKEVREENERKDRRRLEELLRKDRGLRRALIQVLLS